MFAAPATFVDSDRIIDDIKFGAPDVLGLKQKADVAILSLTRRSSIIMIRYARSWQARAWALGQADSTKYHTGIELCETGHTA